MRRSVAVAMGVWCLAILGCSARASLTEDLRNKLGDQGISTLQYYVSGDIVLRRVLRTEEGGVTPGHTLRVDKGRKVEEVVIAAKTPGIILKAEPGKLQVSFEEPVDGKEVYVLFQEGLDGRYYLFPTRMDGDNMLVDYGGQLYVASRDSRVAHLEMEQDKVTTSSRESRQATGRHISDIPQK
jgi:hypothetical protein